MNRAPEIIQHHLNRLTYKRKALEEAIKAGELLVRQREEELGVKGEGNWLNWIKTELPFSQMTVSRYIRCWEKWVIGPDYEYPSESITEYLGEEKREDRRARSEAYKAEREAQKESPFFRDAKPPEPSEEEKKFREAQQNYGTAPLPEKDKELIRLSIYASWKGLEGSYYNERQFEEAVKMHLDFWTEKSNELIKRKFRKAAI